MLNKAAKDLCGACEHELEDLHQMKTKCNSLLHQLDHAVLEGNIVKDEKIVFNGTTAEFLDLIGPFLLSPKWRVNDKHDISPFVRTLSTAIFVRYSPKADFLTPKALENSIKNYLERHKEDTLR